MADYLIRIELYGSPSGKDYETLHEKMRENSFYRVVLEKGKTYWLPHAEYTKSSANNIDSILTEADKIAKSVYKNPLGNDLPPD